MEKKITRMTKNEKKQIKVLDIACNPSKINLTAAQFIRNYLNYLFITKVITEYMLCNYAVMLGTVDHTGANVCV
jgi:hypothetical protein